MPTRDGPVSSASPVRDAPPEQRGRTIFIGDIHGCRGELEALLQAMHFEPGADRLLLTGDAFTRGPNPAGVWQAIRTTGAEMVLGNHEADLLPHLRVVAAGGTPEGAHASHRPVLAALTPHAAELVAWLDEVPLWIDEPRFLLVHAGVNPETGLTGSTPAELLAIRTWPPNGGISGRRWHDHVAPGKLIVFGHDAPGGLVVKRGKAPARCRPRRSPLPGGPGQRLRVRRQAQRLPAGGEPHRAGAGTRGGVQPLVARQRRRQSASGVDPVCAIRGFRDWRTERFFDGRRVREFQGFADQATRRLTVLDNAESLVDLAGLPSNRLESLSGDRTGEYSIRINVQWRICFRWGQEGPYDVEIVDYHQSITNEDSI